jgi:transglutaminase-like putative cysteine protease
MKLKFRLPVLLLILSIVFSTFAYAGGDIKYRVSDIPRQLLKDAKAVVRNDSIQVKIVSDAKVVLKRTYAITILNKNGASNANFMQPYAKNMKVSAIKAQMYDEDGAEIKKKGGFDILDYALISDGTTFADHRIKAVLPEHLEYPYTIEYSYEISFTDVIQYPGWQPFEDFEVAVEKSKYTLMVSKQAKCRYYVKNISTPVQLNTGDFDIYTWEINNMPAYADENFSPALADISPVVLIAPSKVNVEGYEGNFETWAGFGQWINQLNKDRNNLSDEAKARINKMTAGIPDDRAKIKLLYEYMQNKTRYVSIQVGIGGFQPFDAETVDRLSYGDCKALSNYMKSLLEAAGISSRYTLVLAGAENPTIHSDFSSNQFNHAVLCVPLKKDTVWLECTSQRNPFNYMGTFTADRKVLVIDENGGILIKTPALTAESDLESRKVNVTFDPSGDGTAYVRTIYRGAAYDNYAQILGSDQVDRKKLLTRRIHVPNFELDNFSMQENKAELPSVTEQLNLSITGYCTRVGEKLMLSLNMMNKLNESAFQTTTRKNPISIKWPVYEIDTVVYNLPQGYTLEKIPAKISLESDFGQYTAEVTKSGNALQYIRSFSVYKGEYPAERYDDIVTFFDKIVLTDENKVMLTKVM